VLFKVVSTMDSMVGYKTPRYQRFGWCGARADDLMNWLPARITWLLVAITAAALPGYSGSKALRIGSEQHGVLPSPNSGWSEGAIAGALKRRLVGPIYMNGGLVTDIWLGEAADAPLADSHDYSRAAALTVATGALATVVSCAILAL
jgi:adenosylcobinamide-phosphate synthase